MVLVILLHRSRTSCEPGGAVHGDLRMPPRSRIDALFCNHEIFTQFLNVLSQSSGDARA